MADLTVKQVDEGAVFVAKVVPGSSGQTRICGLLDGMLKVKVSAPPEKGKANECLLKFLAEKLGVRKSAVSIIAGKSSPVKHIRVAGIAAETLLKNLMLKARDVRG